jgi:glyoxylase-like metal-dependent hydrolase (beta-lactamase superfamily II)
MLVYQCGEFGVHQLLLNEIKTNCFILTRGSEALLIDPTDQADLIISYLHENGLNLKFMIATHGHFDHVLGAAGVIDAGLASTLYIHEREFDEIKKAPSYCLMIFRRKMKMPKVAAYSNELFTLLNNWGIGITNAGGHTKGSCFIHDLAGNFIFTGDLAIHHKLNITLFNSHENTAELNQFIQKMKAEYAPGTTIFPGHGDMTSISNELKKNKKWAYIQQKEDYTKQ